MRPQTLLTLPRSSATHTQVTHREARMHRDAPSHAAYSPQLHTPPDLLKTDDGIKHKQVCTFSSTPTISSPDCRAQDIPSAFADLQLKQISHKSLLLCALTQANLYPGNAALCEIPISDAAAIKLKSKHRSGQIAQLWLQKVYPGVPVLLFPLSLGSLFLAIIPLCDAVLRELLWWLRLRLPRNKAALPDGRASSPQGEDEPCY